MVVAETAQAAGQDIQTAAADVLGMEVEARGTGSAVAEVAAVVAALGEVAAGETQKTVHSSLAQRPADATLVC